ncbi:MAG: DUF3892 domain-containing protein [Deltaproteobacteria bacterium]|nr:DUF3892 domain-containing protein [Deltaproteobacteria bacterium]MBI3295421.1 DUF3892 domain-containing protein [Deltaproteobacteria bacterium]
MFVRAQEKDKRNVVYWNEDGSSVTYSGGNRPLRNQNPGNMGAGPWANRHGAIGKAGGFAVFPNYEVGRAAIFSRLQSPDFVSQSIWDAIPHYAPAKENDVAWYRKLVKQATGLDLQRKIKDLTKSELESLVNAIERAEGKFEPGQIIPSKTKKRVSALKKNKKGQTIAYFVEGMGWLTKGQAIALVRQGEVDAVIARSSSGTIYLRTRPDETTANNLT